MAVAPPPHIPVTAGAGAGAAAVRRESGSLQHSRGQWVSRSLMPKWFGFRPSPFSPESNAFGSGPSSVGSALNAVGPALSPVSSKPNSADQELNPLRFFTELGQFETEVSSVYGRSRFNSNPNAVRYCTPRVGCTTGGEGVLHPPHRTEKSVTFRSRKEQKSPPA
jgi:hypothetical protein